MPTFCVDNCTGKGYPFNSMIIYKATNLINGKCYIGQTINSFYKRKNRHIRASNNKSNVYFHRAFNKYGIDNFSWEVIRICDSIKSLNAWEQYYILYYNSFGKGGYNLQSGGLNYLMSEETKNKISKGNKGKKFSEEHKEKIRQASLNISEETRIKMRVNHIGMRGKKQSKETKKKISKATKGKNNPMYNKRHSDETRKKLSIASFNMSDETKLKMRKAKLGKKASDETKNKMSNMRKGKNNSNYRHGKYVK